MPVNFRNNSICFRFKIDWFATKAQPSKSFKFEEYTRRLLFVRRDVFRLSRAKKLTFQCCGKKFVDINQRMGVGVLFWDLPENTENFENEKKRLISQKSAEKTSSEMIW